MNLQILAYILIFIGVVLKMSGLYYLSANKELPVEQRKKVYQKINWPGNGFLFVGVIILAVQMYS